jgi:hypothetical protein
VNVICWDFDPKKDAVKCRTEVKPKHTVDAQAENHDTFSGLNSIDELAIPVICAFMAIISNRQVMC